MQCNTPSVIILKLFFEFIPHIIFFGLAGGGVLVHPAELLVSGNSVAQTPEHRLTLEFRLDRSLQV